MGFINHVPNLLSLSRVPFTFIIAGLLFSNYSYKHSISFVLFVIASLTDYFDGAIARKYNVVTVFGQLFDALSDKVLTVGIQAVLISLGYYPSYFIFGFLCVITREFFISGLRMAAAKSGKVLAAEKSGKIKTAVQMVGICISFAGDSVIEIFSGNWIVTFSVFFKDIGKLLYIISSLLAIQSGYSYFSKYGSFLMESAKNE
ncbi:CDP-diacylglycerol-glycerol-3-phosphate 3-phosphatidyltransferase [Spironucleus salmonicida]|uniref:CDP-diacylglycerol-glycerol-3-phosphate 3-phosphatidyltransferase n=1 Tax=Spironucleus salmonicida TaxID=348837 RepID=S5TX00_9EUKA|nr:CDP-diacylglycerol-glycerol-3-phosphate 3-phosphatidyltransferase [Spironucleus salmonicida]KAH0572462.1 CDP-diacylglycerol-glycerol-3-phosphate 3-phosphatidyltransferase [Spironucleus salmonicida]|eukprot:EST44569.1 CDP-diacylglycerol-glycerol-3-phosphate 3-phosphatidyltransferase [Spironucleus salmonicida]